MGDNSRGTEAASVDLAINRVLAAEREAREAVEQCRAEAALILNAAEERARAVTSRTERRIKAVHRIADRAVERALSELRKEPGDEVVPEEAGRAGGRLERALDVLVCEIVGGGR